MATLRQSQMTDEQELGWWRHFASKVEPSELPRVGTALLGRRYRVLDVTEGLSGYLDEDGQIVREW